jgi:hypothetical protein
MENNMDRKEAKIQMRAEMEKDIPADQLDKEHLFYKGKAYSANQIMAEVEAGSAVGEDLVDDFIAHNEGRFADTYPKLTTTQIEQATAWMEEDLKDHPEFGNEVVYSEGGVDWTPNKVMVEVRKRSDLGVRFMEQYLDNRAMVEAFLGKGVLDEILHGKSKGRDVTSN